MSKSELEFVDNNLSLNKPDVEDVELLNVQVAQLEMELSHVYQENQRAKIESLEVKENVLDLERKIRGLIWDKSNLKKILDSERKKNSKNSFLKKEKELILEVERLKKELHEEGEKLKAAKSEMAMLQDLQPEANMGENHFRKVAGVADPIDLEDLAKSLGHELDVQKDENQLNLIQIEQMQKELRELSNELQGKDELIEDLYQQIKIKNKKLKRLSEKKKEALDLCESLTAKIYEKDLDLHQYKSRGAKVSISKLIGNSLYRKSDGSGINDDQSYINQIKKSELFDAAWYLKMYSDVASEDVDPATHYYYFGANEGRDPSPNFSTEWYRKIYKDVDFDVVNPLIHYLRESSKK